MKRQSELPFAEFLSLSKFYKGRRVQNCTSLICHSSVAEMPSGTVSDTINHTKRRPSRRLSSMAASSSLTNWASVCLPRTSPTART